MKLLLESIEIENELKRLSNFVIKKIVNKINLRIKEYYGFLRELNDTKKTVLGVYDLSELLSDFKYSNIKIFNDYLRIVTSPPYDLYITLRVTHDENDNETGFHNVDGTRIGLIIRKSDFDSIISGFLNLTTVVKNFNDALLHEFTHSYDKIINGVKYKESKTDTQYYQKYSERNAYYTELLAFHDKFKVLPLREYIENMLWYVPKFYSHITKQQQQRIVNRLIARWNEPIKLTPKVFNRLIYYAVKNILYNKPITYDKRINVSPETLKIKILELANDILSHNVKPKYIKIDKPFNNPYYVFFNEVRDLIPRVDRFFWKFILKKIPKQLRNLQSFLQYDAKKFNAFIKYIRDIK